MHRPLALLVAAALSAALSAALTPSQSPTRSDDPVLSGKPGAGTTPGTERWVVHFQRRPFTLDALRDEYHGTRDPGKVAAIVADLERRMRAHQRGFIKDVKALGGKVTVQLWLVNACAIEIAPKHLKTVRALANVAFLEPDTLDEPLFLKTATNNSNHRADRVNALGAAGRGVAIAISDSGHDSNMNGSGRPHITYSDRGSRTRTRLLFNKKMGRMAADDIHGHGTGVASAAAGWRWNSSLADNGFAFDAKIAGYAVADDAAANSFASTRARAWQDMVREAAQHNIKVGNNSYAGSPDPLNVLQKAGDTAALVADILICTAAGNRGTNIASSQVNLNGLTVGAVNENSKTLAGFSCRGFMQFGGTFPDIVANGVSTDMARRDNESGNYVASGTSFAAPMVAGAAALIRAANPGLKATETKAILLASTSASPGTGSTMRSGVGCGYLLTDIAHRIAVGNQGAYGRGKVNMSTARNCRWPLRVKRGQPVQVAICWNRMDVNRRDFSDLQLRLLRGNTPVADSRSGPNSEEFVRYTAVADEVLTVHVHAFAVRHTGEQEFAWATNVGDGATRLNPCAAGPGYGATLTGGLDFNQDGYPDFAVGHPFATRGNNTNAGRVVIYSGRDGKSLVLCGFGGADKDSNFGLALGMTDVNADGFADVIIGEPGKLVNNLKRGALIWISGKDGLGRGFKTGTNIGLGARLTGAQYLDSDGFGDVVTTDDFGRQMRAFSGKTRQLLWVQRPVASSQNVAINAIDTVGDINNDGLDDIIIGMPTFNGNRGRMEIRSGKDGRLLRRFNGQTVERLGASVAGLGDLDGDGVNDYMFGSPDHSGGRGNCGIQSGRTGTFIHILFGVNSNQRFGYAVGSAGGDVNSDGTPDFFVSSQPTNANGMIQVFSGKDKRPLNTFNGSSRSFGQAALGIRGSGRDRPDMVVGEPGANRVWLHNRGAQPNPPAFTAYGGTCAGSATGFPRAGLVGESPRVGRIFTTSLSSGPRNSVALYRLGTQPDNLDLTVLGLPGCFRLVRDIVSLGVPTNSAGYGTQRLPIPLVPRFAGVNLYVQFLCIDRGKQPLPFSFSNGAKVLIGAHR